MSEIRMQRDLSFAALVTSRWKMAFYMLSKLPLALIARLRVEHFDDEGASVSVPFNYINKNPFGSVYFAPLSMAAELSSGLLALEAVKNAAKPVSMLVLEMQAEYLKKARSRIVFTCHERSAISEAVQQAILTNEATTFLSRVEGRDEQGELVARFFINWTFKTKSVIK